MLTAIPDGRSTFFIVKTRDCISLDSKIAQKIRFTVHFVSFFFKVSSNLRPNPTTYNF